MYGLTDNIVAGPAGHTTAGPAGSFVAGPAGHVTPAPAGHTPVYPVTGPIPYSGAGYVPIDTTPPRIPYAPGGGGVVYQSGSTNAPIPGPAASVPISPATAGGMIGGGHGLAGGGGFGAISGGGGLVGGGYAGGGVSPASSGGSLGGGGISAATGNAGVSGATSVGAPGAVSAGTNVVPPAATSNPGAGPSQGAGMISMAYAGAGFPPMELRVGQALSQPTAGMPPTPGTEGFTVSPGGRVVPSPVGFVQPPQASHFHAPQSAHVAHHPQRSDVHVTHSGAYEPYKPSYVWQPAHVNFGQAVLAGDSIKPSTYEPPHLLFQDERPGVVFVRDAETRPACQVTQVTNQNLSQDFTQNYAPVLETNYRDEKNITLDASTSRVQVVSLPDVHVSSVSVDLSQSVNADTSQTRVVNIQNIVEAQDRVTNLFFIDAQAQSPSSVLLGGPVMARVA